MTITISDKKGYYHGTVTIDNEKYSYVLCKNNREKVFWNMPYPDDKEIIEHEIWEMFDTKQNTE